MKKVISVLLSLTLAVSMLVVATGCGSKEEASSDDKSEKKIVIGCMDSYMPYAYLDEDGNPAGYDVAVMTEAAKRAGYEVEFQCTAWEDLLPGLDAGKWDCVANQIFRSEEKDKLYNLGKVPYIQSDMKIVVAADSDITSLETMNGAKIDVVVDDYATRSLEAYLEDHPDAFELVYTEGTMAMILEDIINGRVAANINDPFTIKTTAEENGVSDKVKIIEEGPFDPCYVVGLFANTDEGAAMRDDFDAAIKEMMEDGTLSKLSEKYLGEDYCQGLEAGIIK